MVFAISSSSRAAAEGSANGLGAMYPARLFTSPKPAHRNAGFACYGTSLKTRCTTLVPTASFLPDHTLAD
jgi:hypothetical protein